ncbi:MAG: disulfide bond formation protein DsbD [Proteobacteria bacterium]|nr:disulfide bond formation protein DsbD [Pseudomonadota bacterium]
MFRTLLIIFALLLASLSPASAQDTSQKTMLRLYTDKTAAVPGEPLRLAIEQVVTEGWHTYWVNPGDSGEPMKIKWDLPSGVKIGEFMWPAPSRIPYGPLMNFGYHDHAVILTDVTVPASLAAGDTLSIKGKANILVCDEICIPETHDIALDLPVAESASPANEDLFKAAASAIPQPVDWGTMSEVDANEARIRITLPEGEDFFSRNSEDIVWFPYEWGYILNPSDQSATYEQSTHTLTLRQLRDESRNVSDIKEAAYLLVKNDRAVIVSGKISKLASPVMGGQKAMPETDASLSVILLFAFIGGLILNLMPCVFPVLSMKALHLVSLPQSERSHAQMSGVMYAAGVIIMFLALGAALYAVRAAGEQLGWGFQLQNPAVVAGIAWLLFVTGLNLAGVFDLRVAFGGEVLLAEKHHPLVTSFGTGVLATLVATPCSAPFMATALGAALVQPMPIALSIFAMVGVGLAFPYAVLCFVPALQKLLPRPGAWMETFRQALAFPMFASAVWLVWVIAQQGGPEAVGWTLAGMVTLAFAIWLVDRQPKTAGARRVVTVLGVILIILTLAGLQLVVPKGESDARHEVTDNYKPFDPESFDHALNDTKNPVFVNMTASWCITCLVNEKVALGTPEVKDLFKTQAVTYFKGDWTNKDPSITAYLQGYGRSGVPIYVYYAAPDAATGKRPEPVVLPQILTPEIMFETIK